MKGRWRFRLAFILATNSPSSLARSSRRNTRRPRRLRIQHGHFGLRIEEVAVAARDEHAAQAEVAERANGGVDAARAGLGKNALAGPAGRDELVERQRRSRSSQSLRGELVEDQAERATPCEIDLEPVGRAEPACAG